MSILLLATKLHIPRLRPELVSRPRLVQRLDEGLSRQLTLVSTPAGFGKTTLLSEWAGRHPGQVAWLALDVGDNDPVRLLAHLIGALQRVAAGLGAEALAAIQSAQSPALEEPLAGLINQLSARAEPLVLILDDYHLVESAAVHRLLTFLLDHQPPALHLVIASRADPPLPLARLRAGGQLAELRLAELRFTAAEAAEFLGHMVSAPVAAEVAPPLTARTEGWIAGLQMAAVSLQGREAAQVQRFLQAFTGGTHFVLDYLAEEVLQRQPPHIQNFLMQTSILDRLSAPLCEAVLRPEGEAAPLPPAAGLLDQLEHTNLFLLPLDDEQHWYRYHQLFADLLRHRLEQSRPEIIPVLQRRASLWHAQNGLMAAAITYALAAQDYARAVELIEPTAEATLKQSEVVTFLGWMAQVPDALVRSRPRLCLYHAWALLINGQPAEAIEARLASVAGQPGTASQTLTLRAFMAFYSGQVSQAIQLARQALEVMPADPGFLRGLTTLTLGAAYLADGQRDAAQQALAEAARLGQKSGNVLVNAMVLSSLAELCRREGQLRQAYVLYQQALERATGADGHRWPIASRALLGLGEIEREWNQLEAAVQHFSDGLALAQQWGQLDALSGFFSLARALQAQGKAAAANAAMTQALAAAQQTELAAMSVTGLNMVQAEIWLMQGNLSDVRRWAEQRGLNQMPDPAELDERDDYVKSHIRKYEYLIAAHLWLKDGQAEATLALLDKILPRLEKLKRPGLVIELHSLRALALQALGQAAEARQALELALQWAEPEGYQQLFLDEGDAMQALLADYVESASPATSGPALRRYAEKLLLAFEPAAASPSPALPQAASPVALLEPLSDRERDVLRLLATSLSAADIAEALCVAVSTVRSHTKSIYAKLGVSGRLQAVDQARALKLL